MRSDTHFTEAAVVLKKNVSLMVTFASMEHPHTNFFRALALLEIL